MCYYSGKYHNQEHMFYKIFNYLKYKIKNLFDFIKNIVYPHTKEKDADKNKYSTDESLSADDLSESESEIYTSANDLSESESEIYTSANDLSESESEIYRSADESSNTDEYVNLTAEDFPTTDECLTTAIGLQHIVPNLTKGKSETKRRIADAYFDNGVVATMIKTKINPIIVGASFILNYFTKDITNISKKAIKITQVNSILQIHKSLPELHKTHKTWVNSPSNDAYTRYRERIQYIKKTFEEMVKLQTKNPVDQIKEVLKQSDSLIQQKQKKRLAKNTYSLGFNLDKDEGRRIAEAVKNNEHSLQQGCTLYSETDKDNSIEYLLICPDRLDEQGTLNVTTLFFLALLELQILAVCASQQIIVEAEADKSNNNLTQKTNTPSSLLETSTDPSPTTRKISI